MTYNELKALDFKTLKKYYMRAHAMICDMQGVKHDDKLKCTKLQLVNELSELTTYGQVYCIDAHVFEYGIVCLPASSLDELELKLTLEGY